MERQLEALEAVLRDEVAAYQALVNRLPFKIALIKKNRVAQLEHLNRQEEQDLKRLTELERARQECLAALGARLPAGDPTLRAMLPLLEAAWRERLAPLGERLAALVGAMRDGHTTCQVLLRASLEYVDFTMGLIGNAVANAQPALYGRADEGIAPLSPSLLLDRRA